MKKTRKRRIERSDRKLVLCVMEMKEAEAIRRVLKSDAPKVSVKAIAPLLAGLLRAYIITP